MSSDPSRMPAFFSSFNVASPIQDMKLMMEMMKGIKEEEERKNVRVEYAGDKIILPENMSYDSAIEWLSRRKSEEQQTVRVIERIEAFPLDGAAAFHRVLARRYGWTSLVPTPGFFGSSPPTMVGMEVGPGEMIQVPWGRCQLPKIEGYLATSYAVIEGRSLPVFQMACEVQRRHENTIKEIAAEVREEVKRASIYRGKAIKMSFRDSSGDEISLRNFTPDFQPRFLDLSRISQEDVIYRDDTADMIKVNLFHPVEHTAAFRRHAIPLRQGVLLEGPYGTGKTLTAYLLAKACQSHGWTFLYLDDVRDLDKALALARLYQPCVIFAEDIDRAVSGDRKGENGVEIDRVLNTLDGIDSKDTEIMVVLTTNDLKAIHPAMLRPGRIDVVVRVLPPDLKTTIKLVRRLGRNLIDASDDDLKAAVAPIVGQNAAFVRETVERAKRVAVARAEGGAQLVVNADDLAIAAESLLPHVELLMPPTAEKSAPGEQFIDAIVDRVHERMSENCYATDDEDDD